MKLIKTAFFPFSFLFSALVAQAAPDSFVYEGVLEDSAGPISAPSTLILKIYDPSLSCLLYEEQQDVTPGADGSFSIQVGSAVAAAKRTGNDPQLSMGSIFAPAGTVRAASSTDCSGGYTAVSGESRRLVINVNAVDLSPAIEISSAPFAISAGNAEKISNYSASKLLRSDGAAPVAALNDAHITVLMNLLKGTLGSAPTTNGEVASKGYVDSMAGTIKGAPVDTTGIGANKILKYDGSKWIMGEDLTGTLNVDNASSTTLGLMKAGPGLKDNGTSDGVISVNTGTAANQIVQLDASAKLPAVDGSALMNLNPASLSGGFNALSPLANKGELLVHSGTSNAALAVGANGQVLTADSSQPNGLKWSTPALSGGTVTMVSGIAPISVTSGALSPEVSISQASSTTNGYVSSADWNTFNSKMDRTLTGGRLWVGNASSTASEVALSGDATMDSLGVVTVSKTTAAEPNKILALNSSGIAKVKGVSFFNGTNVVNMYPPSSGGGYNLQLPGVAPAAGQFLIGSDAAGTLAWGGVNVSSLKSTLGAAQFPTTCTVAQTLVWSSPADAFICANIKQANAATVSTADQTIYVSSTAGNDSTCNGRAPTAGAPDCPFSTLQKAVDSIPDFVNHRVTIEVLTNLTATTPGVPLAIINKSVAAYSPTTGPMITIQGPLGKVTLNGGGGADSKGIIVNKSSGGVFIKELIFANFSDTAVDVEGGLAIVDNSNFNNNRRALSVSSAGRLMIGGNINITLPSIVGDSARAIEVYQGSFMSEAALNIDLGIGENNRGIGAEYGDVSIEESMSITANGGNNYQSLIEIGSGATLSLRNTAMANAINLYLNSGNNVSGLNVRGGKIYIQGTLNVVNAARSGLSCESGATCEIYGSLLIPSGGAYESYVSVRDNSNLNLYGNVNIGASLGTGASAFLVQNNSSMKFRPNVPGQTMSITGGMTGSTVVRVSNNSQFIVDPSVSYGFNLSPNMTLVEASKMSYAEFSQYANSTYSTYPLKMDDSSKITTPGTNNFAVPTRICPANMTAVGFGRSAFCMDSFSSPGVETFYNTNTTCANRGLEICSKRQLAMYCAAGGMVSNHWTDEMHSLSCDLSTLSVSTALGMSDTLSSRCCL